MDRREQEQAYTGTAYQVEAPEAPFFFRIGEESPEIDALLRDLGAEEWAFITAYNPRSEQEPHETNRQRHARLLARLDGNGYTIFSSKGIDDDDTWPSERGAFIVGIPRREARLLGRDFEQNAIVVGRRGAPPELLFCLEPEESRNDQLQRNR